MIRKTKIYVWAICMLILLSLQVGCGIKDTKTLQISLTPAPTLSPDPTVSPTPEPTPTTVPLLYKQFMPSGAFPKPEEYGEFYDKLNSYERWLLSDDGIQSRIDYVMEYFDVTDSEATYLLEAYYEWNDKALDLVNFDTEGEAMNIDSWIFYMLEYEYIPEENNIQYIVERYKSGEEICLENWKGSGFADLIAFYEEVETITGDIHNTDTYWNNQIVSSDSDKEETALPVSSNGEVLQFGDKVKYEATGVVTFGGTVYEVNGSKVKVKWEVRGDMNEFPSSYLTEEDKDAASMMFNIWDQPYDTEEMEASELEKVSYLLW